MIRMLSIAAVIAVGAMPALAAGQVPGAPLVLADATLLDVVAEGRTTRVPDLAVVSAGVVTQSDSAAGALSANAAQMARVLAAVRRAGVESRDIQTAAIGLSPQYRYGENVPPVITGYQATNRLTVRLRDIARSGAILDTLVREGANQIDGPTLMLAQPDAAMDEARADAIAQARARAELYAKAAGLRVDRIATIAEGSVGGGMPVPPPIVMARMDAAAPQSKIEAGEQDVTATVTVRFVLR